MNLSIELKKFGKEEDHILTISVNGASRLHTFLSTSDDVESLFNEFVRVAIDKFNEIILDLGIYKKIEAKESGVVPVEDEPKTIADDVLEESETKAKRKYRKHK